jgi:toxin ParE1/3/4
MAKYILTNEAVKDLSEIWNYTFDFWSEHQADIYYHMLLEHCRKISEKPQVGNKYHGLVDQLYGIKAGRHIVFYRIISSNEVEITRILHERMDLKKKIKIIGA